MKITVLGSGSKGNATYIEAGDARLLIDAGLSYRQLKLRAAMKGIDIDALDAVLITHEHSDHVFGLDMLMKRTSAVLYAPPSTAPRFLEPRGSRSNPERFAAVCPEKSFSIRQVNVCARRVSHDAEETMGFVVEFGGKKLVYLTDIGFLSAAEYPIYSNAHMYVFEANYDAALLFSSDRPFHLKRRIDSVKGHMSNHDSAYHMSRLVGPNTKTVVLAHPSEECNTPIHALETYAEIFNAYGLRIEDYNIVVAKQHEPIGPFAL